MSLANLRSAETISTSRCQKLGMKDCTCAYWYQSNEVKPFIWTDANWMDGDYRHVDCLLCSKVFLFSFFARSNGMYRSKPLASVGLRLELRTHANYMLHGHCGSCLCWTDTNSTGWCQKLNLRTVPVPNLIPIWGSLHPLILSDILVGINGIWCRSKTLLV